MGRARGRKEIRALNPEKYSEALSLFLRGMRGKDIAKRIGCTGRVISKWIRKYGWEEKRDKQIRNVESRVASAVEDKEVDERVRALKDLRVVRSKAVGTLRNGVKDPRTGQLIDLLPMSFSEASAALLQAIRTEAELEGWRVASPAVVALVVGERQRVASDLVTLATDILAAAIPEGQREKAVSTFRRKLEDLEEQIQSPPMLPAKMEALTN